MGSVSSPRALPIYIFTLAHGFIPLLDTPLCVPPWAKRPMIAHTYHNKEWTVLDLLPTEGLGILRYEIHVLLLRIFALPPHVMAWLASLCDSAAA